MIHFLKIHSLKKLFRRRRPRQSQVHQAPPADDQPDLRNAHPDSPAPSEVRLTADNDASQRHFDSAQELRQTFPPTCSWLGPGDLDVGEHAVAGGRHAEVLKGRLDGRDIAVKSYRRYRDIHFDYDRVRMRSCREAHALSLLSHRNIVSLVGVSSTLRHPLSLVFDPFMEHLDPTEYFRKQPSASKVELVAGIARGLYHMHDVGVVHGNLERTNVVVGSDGTPRIAGLGSALVQSSPVTWPGDPPELTRCSAAELVNPGEFGLPNAQITKESDVYSFGVLVYEVFAGSRVFPQLLDNAAIYSMSVGTRPSRPHDPELSDRIWDMINRCWAHTPSQRITIAEAVSVLETELRETRGKPSR